MKYILGILLLAVNMITFISCNRDIDYANKLIDEALSSYAEKDYNRSLLLLDSLKKNYPHAVSQYRKALLLSYRIDLQNAKQIKIYTDSMLLCVNSQINSLLPEFSLEKSEYDDIGRYIYKGTEAENNAHRSYIHSAVEENGRHHLISSHTGRNIQHTFIRVKSSNGTSCTTQTIPLNDATNYNYNILGKHYETVTFIEDKDGGVLNFIYMHAGDNKIEIELGGGKSIERVKLSELDRKGLIASLNLSIMIKEKNKLKQENQVAADKITYLTDLIILKEQEQIEK